MTVFSNDSDILRYEPALFVDLHFPWQVLCKGSDGVLNGTCFSSASADFVSAGVSTGGVIYLRVSGGIEGCFEIVSVDSATELTVSVLRADSQAPAVSPSSGSGMTYRISTFAPQAAEVMYVLTGYFGIGPGNPNSVYDVDDILDVSVLRQASVYAVIAGVYATLGSGFDGDEDFWKKSLHYQKLFEKARERCRLSVDIGNDGVSDRTSVGGSVRIVRD